MQDDAMFGLYSFITYSKKFIVQHQKIFFLFIYINDWSLKGTAVHRLSKHVALLIFISTIRRISLNHL